MFKADAQIDPPEAPIIAEALQSLTEPSRACIERLLKHFSETRDKHYSLFVSLRQPSSACRRSLTLGFMRQIV